MTINFSNNSSSIGPWHISQIARLLGGDVMGKNGVRCPGPGHSSRDRSLSVTFAGDSFTVYSHAGDDWRACKDYVRDRLGLGALSPVKPVPALNIVKSVISPERDRDLSQRIRWALEIWRSAQPIPGTLAETYLASRRVTHEGEEIRFHGALRFDGGAVPGMVALMRDVFTNEPCGIHRTFLTTDGRKLVRRMLGRARGACVKLTPDTDVTCGLGIAEGIETALSVMQAGWHPVWACLSAGAVASFPVLPGVDSLTVFADHDVSGTGEQSARDCIARWIAASREAQAILPRVAGIDFNDALRAAT